MDENERILTVQDFLTPSYVKDKYSRILLQGKWLRDSGFAVGNKVSVKVETLNHAPQLIVKLVD